MYILFHNNNYYGIKIAMCSIFVSTCGALMSLPKFSGELSILIPTPLLRVALIGVLSIGFAFTTPATEVDLDTSEVAWLQGQIDNAQAKLTD
jgi:hypothetical protein